MADLARIAHIKWMAANDDAPGSSRPPKPFFLTRFWRFDLPFACLWIGGWAVYVWMRWG